MAPAAECEPAGPPPTKPEFPRVAELAGNLTPELAAGLAAALGLPVEASDLFAALGVGYDHGGAAKAAREKDPPGWATFERDDAGRIVGACKRAVDGTKRQYRQATRALYFDPARWSHADGPVVVTEGFSCTAAATVAGLAVVGRPFVSGGAAYLAELLRHLPADRDIVLLAENDLKPFANIKNPDHVTPAAVWPGLTHTRHLAADLARRLGRPVRVAVVPDGAKDLRDWFVAETKTRTGKPPTLAAWRNAGARFLAAVAAVAYPVEPGNPADVPPPPLDETRPCKRCRHLHMTGKPGTTADGQSLVGDFRCRSWQCPACNPRRAGGWYRHLVDCILPLADSDHAAKTAESAPEAEPPLDYPSIFRGTWSLYAATVATGKHEYAQRATVKAGGEYVRVVCLPPAGGLMAPCIAFRGDKPLTSGQYQRTNPAISAARDPAEADPAGRTEAVSFMLIALPPTESPPRGFTPVGTHEAIRLLGSALANVPLWSPDPDGKRSRPVSVSDGWRMPDPTPGNWTTPTASAMTPGEVAEVAAAVGMAAPVKCDHAELQGEVAGINGPATHQHVLAGLAADTPRRPLSTVPDVIRVQRLWMAFLPADQPAGPCVLDYITSRLWDGPDPADAGRLADWASADREIAELRAASAAKPFAVESSHPTVRDRQAERERRGDELMRRREARRGNRHGRGDLTRTPKYLRIMQTVGR